MNGAGARRGRSAGRHGLDAARRGRFEKTVPEVPPLICNMCGLEVTGVAGVGRQVDGRTWNATDFHLDHEGRRCPEAIRQGAAAEGPCASPFGGSIFSLARRRQYCDRQTRPSSARPAG